MPSKQCLMILAAAAHLCIVICGAAYWIPARNDTLPGEAIRWYATMSEAESSYGFFAPAVGTPHRARFLLKDESGQTWEDSFDDAANAEARLRLTGIVDGAFMSGAANESPEWRGRLVSSWAATMFSRHPDAVSLTVVVETWHTPDMADYRAGTRQSWQEVYRGEVQRRSVVDDGRGHP